MKISTFFIQKIVVVCPMKLFKDFKILFFIFFYRPYIEEFEIPTDKHIKKNLKNYILDKFTKIE